MTAWFDAPLPRRLHQCRPHTVGTISGALVERCACGAVRLDGRMWIERNSRRPGWRWPGTDTGDGRRNKRVTLRWIFVLMFLTAVVLFGAGVAKADEYCTTSHMSGMTITFCRYSNPWYPSTTTVCYDRSGDCTTTGGSN